MGDIMLKLVLKIFKKVIIGIVLLFGYNTFLTSLNVMIPINIVTIVLATIFDIPGIIGIVIFYLINY